jgi:uncharacterized protein YidB (DUF937 family)
MDLSNILSNVTGDGGSKLVAAAAGLIEREGGISSLVEKLRSSGLKGAVDSWVGRGKNQPVDGTQMASVLGKDQVAQVAAEAGTSEGEAGHGLSEILPNLIDQATPDGQLPADGGDDALSSLKAALS